MISLADMAYTLQVGREPMASRLAMVVSNRQELTRGLKAYLDNTGDAQKTGMSFYYPGDLENNHTGMEDFLSEKVAETIVEMFMMEKDYKKIANYWANGGEIPWESLYEGETVRRISLPGYPFAKERYWVSVIPQLQAVQETPAPDEKMTTKTDVDEDTGSD